MDAPIIVARGLTKRFGDRVAVAGVDFSVGRGEVFGFLGRNGAGKTSTMRMVASISRRSSGELKVFGVDPDRAGPAVRARLGVVPQDDTLDLELTILQNLTSYARFFGIPRSVARGRAEQLLELMQLDARSNERVYPLSGGLKRRVAIARALINEPELLLLDEPTTGLDPHARQMVWERFRQLRREGTTILLNTHFMDEAEQLCDQLVVMEQGTIIARGSPAALIAAHAPPEVLELQFDGPPPSSADALAGPGRRVERLPDRVLVYAHDRDEVGAIGRDLGPCRTVTRKSNLEDVFLILSGRALVD
jgi:lipooligosaccharide transport system ATP-binding protein